MESNMTMGMGMESNMTMGNPQPSQVPRPSPGNAEDRSCPRCKYKVSLRSISNLIDGVLNKLPYNASTQKEIIIDLLLEKNKKLKEVFYIFLNENLKGELMTAFEKTFAGNSDFTKNPNNFLKSFNEASEKQLAHHFAKIENFVDPKNQDEGSISEIKNESNINKSVHLIVLTALDKIFQEDQTSADSCFKKYFYQLKPSLVKFSQQFTEQMSVISNNKDFLDFIIKFYNELFFDESFWSFFKNVQKGTFLFPFASKISKIDQKLKELDVEVIKPLEDSEYVLQRAVVTNNYYNYANQANEKLKSIKSDLDCYRNEFNDLKTTYEKLVIDEA
jgi:hypothetical protein